jgi:hypothetical protein
MAQPDPGIRKVTLRQKDIGAMYTNQDDEMNPVDKYFLRYRIVSEDGTKTSRWSQIYSVDGSNVVDSGTLIGYTVLSNATVISVSWKLDSKVFGTPFDVYVRWNESSTKPTEEDAGWSAWEFASETTSSSASVNTPSNKRWVQVYVQRQTFPKIRTAVASLFTSSVYSTRSTTDSGLVSEL